MKDTDDIKSRGFRIPRWKRCIKWALRIMYRNHKLHIHHFICFRFTFIIIQPEVTNDRQTSYPTEYLSLLESSLLTPPFPRGIHINPTIHFWSY